MAGENIGLLLQRGASPRRHHYPSAAASSIRRSARITAAASVDVPRGVRCGGAAGPRAARHDVRASREAVSWGGVAGGSPRLQQRGAREDSRDIVPRGKALQVDISLTRVESAWLSTA